jgi:hypothetical protein
MLDGPARSRPLAAVVILPVDPRRQGDRELGAGDPVREAKVKCQDGVFLERDFDRIGDLCGRMITELRELPPWQSISPSMRWASRRCR